VPLQLLSKATLVDLSHVLEDMVAEQTLRGVIVTGFQYASNWRSEVARYTDMLATAERRVAIFTRDQIPDAVEVQHFQIQPGSGFEQEWFILARTEVFSCALFGLDQQASANGTPPREEADRLFLSGWTFDPQLVDELAKLVVQEAASTDPEGARSLALRIEGNPPVSVSEAIVSEFNRRVFQTMEVSKQRLRESRRRERAASKRAIRATERNLRLERLSTIGNAAAAFAHEVNNPLQSILALAEHLSLDVEDLAGALPPGDPSIAGALTQLQEAALSIGSAAHRIGGMTRSILDLARQGAARLEPVELLEWLSREAGAMAGSKQGRVDLSRIGGGTPVWVRADAERLYHVVSNLVSNGLAADRRDPPEVRIELVFDPARVGVRVIDHGHGIPEELRESLFEPFVTSKQSQGGTGLGLALAKRYAQDQFGSLIVEETGHEGTVMTLWLPVEEEPLQAWSSDQEEEEIGHLPARVLLLDDDDMARSTIGLLLKRLGVEHESAATASAALGCLETAGFDACLIDFDLGHGRNGVEIAMEWAREQRLPIERFVLITGNLERTLPPEYRGRVLLKPFGLTELRAALTLANGGVGSR
jgi:signal transduction histidine kinase/CheY-like chemotaxis protein